MDSASQARVGVPLRVSRTVTPDKPDATIAAIAAIEVLTSHIARIETELATVKGERDQAKEAAMQVHALRATLEAVSAERDRWIAAATAPRGLARFFRRG